jgi:transcriptional regulator with XRE-family HTH domain
MKEDINKIIGERLQKLRKAKGLSQGGLGKLIGEKSEDKKSITGQSIQYYEAGETNFTAKMLLLLSEIFNVNPSYFLKTKKNIIFKKDEKENDIILSINTGNRTDYIKLVKDLEKINDQGIIKNISELVEKVIFLQEKR